MEIEELSSISYSTLKSNIDFIYRGDALYWNPLAIKTEKKLLSNGAIPLSEIAVPVIISIHPKLDATYNLIELADIDGDSGLTCSRSIKGYEVESTKHQFQKNDVLFGKLRFYIKNIGIAHEDGIGSSEIIPIRLNDKRFTPEYIFLYLRSKFTHNILIKRSKGSNHPRIAETDLFRIPFLLLSTDSISKLTLRVKEAFQLFQKSQDEYFEAKKILQDKLNIPDETKKQYNSYVLWKKKISMEKNLSAKYWIEQDVFFKDCLKIGGVTESVFQGRTPAWNMYSDNEGVRILKVRHLSNDGLSWELKKRDYVNPRFYEKNHEVSLKINDILVASAAHNASYIGKDISIVDSIPTPEGKAIASAKLNVIRPNPQVINPVVLLLFMQERIFYSEIQRHITGQTAEICAEDIQNELPVPKDLLLSRFPESDEIERLYISSVKKKRKSINIIKTAIKSMEDECDSLLIKDDNL